MHEKFRARLEKDPNLKNLFSVLTDELSNSDLQSLLIEAFRVRSMHASPAGVLREYRDNRFYRASEIPQKVYHKFDLLSYSLLPGDFHSLDLSPVTPLGTSTSMSNLSQNRMLSTIRNSEVVSDPTTIMALHAALIRKKHLGKDAKSAQTVNCCASHRILRTQRFKQEKFSAHFRVFALVSAGRDTGNSAFELDRLENHLRFYLALCNKLDIVDRAEVQVSDFSGEFNMALVHKMFGRLGAIYGKARFKQLDNRAEARNYYSPLAFRIRFTDTNGETWDVVDGGFTNWTQSLLNSRKERFFSSAIGTDLLFRVFPGVLTLIDEPINLQR